MSLTNLGIPAAHLGADTTREDVQRIFSGYVFSVLPSQLVQVLKEMHYYGQYRLCQSQSLHEAALCYSGEDLSQRFLHELFNSFVQVTQGFLVVIVSTHSAIDICWLQK